MTGGWRRIAWTSRAAFVLFALTIALAGCDPGPVPDDPRIADLQVDVGRTGGLRAELALAPSLETEAPDLTDQIASTAFGTTATSSVDANGGGYPLGVISVEDAYEPGHRPAVDFTLGVDTMKVLADAGIERLDASVCAPVVPRHVTSSPEPASHAGRCTVWNLRTESQTLEVTLAMTPHVRRWTGQAALTTAAALFAALAGVLEIARRRRRRLPAAGVVSAAAIGVLSVAVAVVATGIGPNADNLGVAGRLDGRALDLATWFPMFLLPLGLLCVGLAVSALTDRNVASDRPTGAG